MSDTTTANDLYKCGELFFSESDLRELEEVIAITERARVAEEAEDVAFRNYMNGDPERPDRSRRSLGMSLSRRRRFAEELAGDADRAISDIPRGIREEIEERNYLYAMTFPERLEVYRDRRQELLELIDSGEAVNLSAIAAD